VKDKRVAIICGTRPEVIKLYPVHQDLLNRGFNITLISTGQQQQLLKETFDSLNFFPDIDLALMTVNQSPTKFLTAAMTEISTVLLEKLTDFVIVQGDTLSAYAGAFSAYLNQIPVGHVEAGLRSHDLSSPWPEEGIRRSIDSISSILWVPTSGDQIKIETDQRMFVTGNTVVDSLRLIVNKSQEKHLPQNKILVTLHRRESFGDTMTSALRELIKLSLEIPHRIVFIQHPNPNVEISLKEAKLLDSRIEVIKPIPYVDFIQELRSCDLLITDSGGLQEESTVLGIPALILRDKTERNAAIRKGMSKLSPPNGELLVKDAIEILNQNTKALAPSTSFGDGFASQRIVDSIVDFLN